jgi:alkanesulfonate monooxygenase SsuD/methylene tetrahydromethanopterin reductase-like flavin-dependent oxidoreductase (luciferase family)
MDLGIFCVPYTKPGRAPYDVAEWNLEQVRWADELNFSEAWFAEHYTIGWEPLPSPDLMIAAALRETKQIKLAPGAHLLPYHNPIELAYRVSWIDHMAKGRYILGVGAGAFPSDQKLFATEGHNAEMTSEALEIMHKVWEEDGPFEFKGKYWSVGMPEWSELDKGPHLKPFQAPHPPIAMAGSSPRSGTLKEAGRRGYEPLSLGHGPGFLATHWEAYCEGADEAGLTPDRKTWRIARDFFVAETDEEAIDLVVNGGLGYQFDNYVKPLFSAGGILGFQAPELDESEITAEYLARNAWLVGSPETVTERLRVMHEETGGFGTLLLMTSDYSEQPEAMRRCLELLSSEVMPKVAKFENTAATS